METISIINGEDNRYFNDWDRQTGKGDVTLHCSMI